MANPFAFVTLLTLDSYLPGALALVGALKDVHPSPSVYPEVDFDTVCLVTPESVNVTTIKLLRRAFDVVVGVELIGQEDKKNLTLLGRPDLHAVLTKLHIFRLIQYKKIIFLDADVLPIRPLSHLFHIAHPFSAVPDVGWPDIFNSGVLVISPGEDKFNEVRQLLGTQGSWDGGDQGILNEWRGSDWNRLSFTYNTTPTAAYTYAPAYERFGSQISAIHFIGPDKPWNSIPYRTPGTITSSGSGAYQNQTQTSSQTQTSQDQIQIQVQPSSQPESISQPSQTTAQQSYDYASLVDRWYAVYDSHYRSEALIPESSSEFGVKKYVSAWDEPAAPEPPASSSDTEVIGPSAGAALGLEDLRRLAVEGMGSAKSGGGEGEYRSMPLDGRVDLMRPKAVHTEEPRTPVGETKRLHGGDGGGSPVRMWTLPTPAPSELPPAPYLGGHSLPATPVLPSQGHQHQDQSQHQQPHHHEQQQQHSDIYRSQVSQAHNQQQPPKQERPRVPSPPLLSWNPSIEPPPNTLPTPSAFPSTTYFPNVWDQSRTSATNKSYQSDAQQPSPKTSPTIPDSRSFFEVPPPSDIPEQLVKQGHYRNVTGLSSDHSTPSPDRTKVKRVFPWEEKPRHVPGRVFPGSESSPPGAIFLESLKSEPPPEISIPERRTSPVHATPSPLNIGFSPTLTYANAWDTVPQITKYASRLVRPYPAALFPLASAFEETSLRRKNWDDRLEVSSRDGDDEDEGDDEGDGGEGQPAAKWDDDEVNKQMMKARSRSGSISSARIKGKYRSQGVQTIPRVKRNVGVQTTEVEGGKEKERPNGKKLSPRAKKQLSPTTTATTGLKSLPPVMDLDQLRSISPTGTRLFKPMLSFPAAHPSAGTRSPREVTSPQASSTTSSPPLTGPTIIRSLPLLLPSNGRKMSIETNTSKASPLSSVGPASPVDPLPTALPSRKAGRVWDPARGVELFKRGSEEVLARFLKMGSWEDDSPIQ